MPEPRVVYWNNIPSPYFVERMNAIAVGGQIDLHCVFNKERNDDRSWDVDASGWQFEHHWAEPSIAATYAAEATVRRLAPDVLVSLYGEPSFATHAPLAARYAARWAIRVVPTYTAWETRTRAKELVKRALGRMVDGAKVPGPDGRAYAGRLGVPQDRIFEVQQSVPVAHFARTVERVEGRASWSIGQEDFVFVYVGRLWEGKGIRVLLDALALLPQEARCSLLFVGDGPMDTELRNMSDPRIRVAGFVQRDVLPDLLGLCDCLVFPTLGDPFGLVVEESMAAGLPVITSDQMGDALARVRDTGAGIVVAEQTPAAWAAAMKDMMLPATHDRHAAAAVRTAPTVDHAAYVRDFTAFTRGLLELPSRRPMLRGSAARTR